MLTAVVTCTEARRGTVAPAAVHALADLIRRPDPGDLQHAADAAAGRLAARPRAA